MSLALYREFRPKTFEQVVGQDHITRTLSNQIKNNNTTHAYLFTGPRGTGKTSCAKIFSRAINCLNPKNGSPCGECEVCKALSTANTDVLEIDAASNNRVDEIRDLREKVKYPPIIAKYKVYIIDEVHMLTDSAFNALLKTLEEPPKHVIFILATTDVHKLPATILSRCTRFDFRLLSIEELKNHLSNIFKQKNISCDEKSLYLIAKQGQGSVRDTLSIADSVSAYCENNITFDKTLQILSLDSIDSIKSIINSIVERDVSSLFLEIKKSLNNGKNISYLCKEMADYFKSLIMVKYGVKDFSLLEVSKEEFDEMQEIANKTNINICKLGFEKFARAELDLKYCLNPENLFESICLELVENNNQEKVIEKVHIPTVLPAQINKDTKPVVISEEKKSVEQMANNSPADNAISNLDNESVKSFDVGKLWGTVLLNIKSKNMFALSANLRSVYGVELFNTTLTLHTNDKSVFSAINDDSKKEIILNEAKSINKDITRIQIIYDEDKKNENDIINELKNTFMDKLRIK